MGWWGTAAAAWAALLGSAVTGSAAEVTVDIAATRDNTLYEDPIGSFSNGAGRQLFVGRVGGETRRRAVVAFDDLSAIPQDAWISDAELVLRMDRTIVGPVEIQAHVLTAPWGEGTSRASRQEGAGAPSTVGDATWIHRRFDADLWANAGGDFLPATLATATVDQVGSYVWRNRPAFSRLVDDWRTGARDNHGLLLLGEGGRDVTAKRFSSREGTSPPILRVTYAAPENDRSGQAWNLGGLWFDPAADGEGYSVIENAGSITVFYFGYGADGTRLWLVSDTVDAHAGPGPTLRLQMFVGAPGSFDQPTPSTALEAWGWLEITAGSCGEARFELSGIDGAKVSEAVNLVAPQSACGAG